MVVTRKDQKMKRVILETQLAGENNEKNLTYARHCTRDCIMKGEAPFASHLIYTQPGVLDEDDPVERILATKAGLAWAERADYVVVYQDLGISPIMTEGIEYYTTHGLKVHYRKLPREAYEDYWADSVQ
jgi:hypothetical protein